MDAQALAQNDKWSEENLSLLNLINPALAKIYGRLNFFQFGKNGSISTEDLSHLELKQIAETLKTGNITCQENFCNNGDGTTTLPFEKTGTISSITVRKENRMHIFSFSNVSVPI
jgi:hypothetical protein